MEKIVKLNKRGHGNKHVPGGFFLEKNKRPGTSIRESRVFYFKSMQTK